MGEWRLKPSPFLYSFVRTQCEEGSQLAVAATRCPPLHCNSISNRTKLCKLDQIDGVFLKQFGLGAAGVTAGSLALAGAEQVKETGSLAKAELERLQLAYDKLDTRTKLLTRGLLILLGLDLFLLI